MSILDKMKDQFKTQLSELKSFEVAEIEETIYYRPTANVAQMDKYWPLIQQNKLEGFVELVCARALNDKGARIFKPKDKQVLMKDVNPEIIIDIANKILEVDSEAREEAGELEKN